MTKASQLPRPRGAVHGRGVPMSRKVLAYLQREIDSGRWPIGSRIPIESALVVGLDVGRTTVREAVSTLVHLGLLEAGRGSGTFVRSRTAIPTVLAEFTEGYDLADLQQAQLMLEVDASRAAAERRTDADLERLRLAHERDVSGRCRDPRRHQFHALVFQAAGNRMLTDLNAGLEARIRRALLTAEDVAEPPGPEDVRGAHQAILDAIEARDPDAAASAARRHG